MSQSVEAMLVRRARKTMEGIPPDVAAAASRSVADMIGVALSACSYESVEAFVSGHELARPAGNVTARMIGTGKPLPVPIAAAANAMAGHIHDFDDDDPVVSLAHPTVVVFNAALAVADAYDVAADKLLRAHVAGVETMMRLGMIANPDHYNAGWHATASLGIFGATMAAGLLLDLSDEELEYALGIAASMAAGLKGNFGSDLKPLQVGLAAANGVTAAQLAGKGIRSTKGALFGNAGFLATAGSRREAAPIIEAFGEPYGLVSPGLNIKIYPCCSSCHTSIDGFLELLNRHSITREEVETVTSYIGRDVPKMLFYDVPKTGLEAKFSLKYCLAAALKNGSVTLQDFEDRVVNDPGSVDAMQRINVLVDETIPTNSETGVTHQSRVEIKLKSGQSFAGEFIHPRGSPENPIDEDELRAKFTSCARTLGGEDRINAAFRSLTGIGKGGSTRALVDHLVVG